MKVLDHEMLVTMNESSIRAGRNQHLRPGRVPAEPQNCYWININIDRERDGHQEVRVCVVLSLVTCQTAWLDLSPEEYNTIPEIDVHLMDWETAMCAGTPQTVP